MTDIRLSRLLSPVFLVATLAMAQSPALAGDSSALLSAPLVAAMPSDAVTVTFDVSGIDSITEVYNTTINRTFYLPVGADTRIIGIGWDVNITAFAPSWMSEVAVNIGNNLPFIDRSEFDLNPGFGQGFPGTGSFSSGGVRDLVGLGLDFAVTGDGLLVMEFYDGFDDPEVAIDGRWNSGTLTLVFAPVPEAGTWAMMLMGLGLLPVAARRARVGQR